MRVPLLPPQSAHWKSIDSETYGRAFTKCFFLPAIASAYPFVSEYACWCEHTCAIGQVSQAEMWTRTYTFLLLFGLTYCVNAQSDCSGIMPLKIYGPNIPRGCDSATQNAVRILWGGISDTRLSILFPASNKVFVPLPFCWHKNDAHKDKNKVSVNRRLVSDLLLAE